MKSIGKTISRKGIVATGLALGLFIPTGCEDRIDSPIIPSPEEKTVAVSLTVGWDNEVEGSSLYPATKSVPAQATAGEAFEMSLIPEPETKAMNSYPDSLYNLEVCQYDQNGNFKKYVSLGTQVAGSNQVIGLTDLQNCQLFFVARGKSSAVPSINGKSLAALNEIVADATTLNELTDLNHMPYILHLKDVHMAEGKIRNPEGKDVRVLLKRLAVRLTLDWTFSQDLVAQGYTLDEIRLFQVPAKYSVLPEREDIQKWGTVYPGSATEFVDGFRLTATGLTDANGTYSTWLPANAQGRSAAITSAIYRTKEYVNPATTYVEFVVDHAALNKRLYYRAYLGGNTTTDFNLLENTNYHWKVTINRVDYANDRRIQLLDLAPVKSTNLVPTANCFMMQPGTNICFNPYKHTSGTDGWNDELTDGQTLANDKTITDVKLLWQTKDAGTSGELVMGYVADQTANHTNLVNLEEGSSLENARISVKVPVTKGGNAVIAAYNSAKTIVWNWHLWISDYLPQGITPAITYEQAQRQTKGGSVHQYASAVFKTGIYRDKVIMDRNLCATAGGFPGADASSLEFGRRMGYLYEWGRKEPFFGSVDGTNNEINVIYQGDGTATGLKKIVYAEGLKTDGNTLPWTIQNPMSLLIGNASWYNGTEKQDVYRILYENNGKKSLYDPCPDGWTIPDKSIFDGTGKSHAYWYDSDGTFTENGQGNHSKAGRLYNIAGNTGVPSPQTIHNTAWYPTTAYRAYQNGILTNSQNGYLGSRTLASYGGNYRYYYLRFGRTEWTMTNAGGQIAEPVPYRCIQE